MNYIKLNGISFDADVAISKYNRNFNVLDGENAGRVMTGRMVRDIPWPQADGFSAWRQLQGTGRFLELPVQTQRG